MDLEKYKKLKNYNDIKYMYDKFSPVKQFITNNHDVSSIIINNLNKFISYFKNEFKTTYNETQFIVSCFFEFDYFKDALLDKMNLIIFKKIIVRKIIEMLNETANNSSNIENALILCGLYIDDYSKKISHNYSIIKKIMKTKDIDCNYCYLFDNIEYFNNDSTKLNIFISFIEIILNNFIDTKSYY